MDDYEEMPHLVDVMGEVWQGYRLREERFYDEHRSLDGQFAEGKREAYEEIAAIVWDRFGYMIPWLSADGLERGLRRVEGIAVLVNLTQEAMQEGETCLSPI